MIMVMVMIMIMMIIVIITLLDDAITDNSVVYIVVCNNNIDKNENVHKVFLASNGSWNYFHTAIVECTWVKFLTPNHSPGLQHMYITFLYSTC